MKGRVPRLLKEPRSGFFLFGPRGTGKSTWLRDAYPNALWIDLLEPDVFRRYSARPERLRELIVGNPKNRTVVIDEVQKEPALLDQVHALIEQDHKLRFVLTGSSARKLKRAGVDLLAGRLVLRHMHPFLATELGPSFQLSTALEQGLIPLIVRAKQPTEVLRSYIALYLQEEVKMEGIVRNVGDFSRFLEAVSFSHASVLNISNVARDCEVNRKTVEGYVEILEDLLLAFRLPVFEKRAARATIAHPKFYFFDTGVYRSLRPSGPLDRREEIDGSALEGLVAQHLRAYLDYGDSRARLYYWRTKAGSEVDFVLYGTDLFCALEVKHTARVRPEDLRGLKAFRDDYPEAMAFLLYRGTERVKIDDILCVPCEEFLRNLRPGRAIISD